MIDQSQVYKCLEKKTLILGFELPDLFILSLLLCVLNLLFGDSAYKLFLTWGPPLILAVIFRVMKIGKADGFLFHWIKYHLSPGVMSAFLKAKDNALIRMRRKGRKNARFEFE